jgi:hypothetical protein
MRQRLGHDPLLADIKQAVNEGYFDDRQPSELELTPVEELLKQVDLMSPTRRREYLAELGNIRRGTPSLSGVKPREGRREWLSR